MTSPGTELQELRTAIDDIDRKILELVSQRVRVVLAVGEYKRKHGLPVYDPVREGSMLKRLSSLAEAPLDGDTVQRIFERLIDEARRIEQRHVQGR